MAEDEKPKRKGLYGDSMKKDRPVKDAEPKAEPKKAENSPAPKAEEGNGGDMRERHAKARADMRKGHEGERRDLNGNHREEHRQMAARHEKAMGAMQDQQEAEMASGAQAASVPAAPAGPAGGAPEPQPGA